MGNHILDLHGIKHNEVDILVENFIFLNQHLLPLTIICGNSSTMINLVLSVLKRHSVNYYSGEGLEYGKIKIQKL
tara:strand:- start:1809 stop:2033 length:225 start_codon:yes stop_codon:yes gene_type:complete